MDEPTNHLDVSMIEWLENYLDQENVTLLLVTHDRYFLDSVCNEIMEIDQQKLFIYKGNYENFLEKKSTRDEMDKASVEKARNTYRKELEWMRKQPKARTTKSKSRQDAFYDVKERASARLETQQLELNMKMTRLGGKILELKKVYKAYDKLVILKGFDYTFKKGERVGIVGKNGVGKSTFVNMLLGLEQADSGKINVGETIVFGNYDQRGLIVKEDMRVIEFVKNIAENFPLADGSKVSAAQFLELFLFSPEKQYTYISKLSGGEKRRLHLLSILFRNPNFLVLDEPTNDLDLPTLSILEDFLQSYPGCVIIVSHDRYFMDKIVDHLFVFEGAGEVRDFPGNYSQYREWEKDRSEREKEESKNPPVEAKPVVQEKMMETPAAVPARKMSFKEKRELELLEKEIADLENEKKSIDSQLAAGTIPYDQLEPLSRRVGEVIKLLDEKGMRWLELSEG
jgi:ATP-binding cassette subfamily F protein uup